MAEVITEQQPRIKFAAVREGDLAPLASDQVEALSAICARIEAAGAAPVLSDGLVGGNCGVLLQGRLFVSRSGKPAGHSLTAADLVEVTRFDRAAWKAYYRSSSQEFQPTSDTPLLWACLAARHDWHRQPTVALHGHALAEGPGLEAAQRAGMPISERATLFSTPADLAELEALLARHPFPQHRCFIRLGHGFFLLGESVAAAAATFDHLVAPMLAG